MKDNTEKLPEGASVLVTGGAGFIGSHTVLALLEAGFKVVVADNLCNSSLEAIRRVGQLSSQEFEFHEVELCDGRQVAALFEDSKIDAVIHFAALKAVGESVERPLDYYDNNLRSLSNLLRSMGEHGCRNLVFSSSATVYSTQGEPPYAEESLLAASNPYGNTKLVGEQMIRDFANATDGFRAFLLRYFNPVGAHPSGLIGESPKGLPNNLFPYISRVAAGRSTEVRVFGNDYPTPDGTGIRDYVHVCDLAEGHVAALNGIDQIERVEAVNIGTGRGYSVLEAIHAFRKACGKEIPYSIVARRAGDIAVSVADPSKAKTILNWEACRGLDEMCIDGWRWQSRNPDGYEES